MISNQQEGKRENNRNEKGKKETERKPAHKTPNRAALRFAWSILVLFEQKKDFLEADSYINRIPASGRKQGYQALSKTRHRRSCAPGGRSHRGLSERRRTKNLVVGVWSTGGMVRCDGAEDDGERGAQT